jgi:hypothetical protein
MSRFRHSLVLVLSAAGLASAGCASMSDKMTVFQDTQRRYTQLMRFTDYEKAGRYVVPEERRSFRERTGALGDLRFSDYDIEDVQTSGDSATARVAYMGYRASSPIMVTYVEEQVWEFESGTWQVRSVLEQVEQ